MNANRRSKWGALLLAPIISLSSFDARRANPLGDPALEARAKVLSKELRCVVCQNQSIDDSTAPLAMDLKALLRERLVAGDTDAMPRKPFSCSAMATSCC